MSTLITVAATKHLGEFARTWSSEDERLTKELLNEIMNAEGADAST